MSKPASKHSDLLGLGNRFSGGALQVLPRDDFFKAVARRSLLYGGIPKADWKTVFELRKGPRALRLIEVASHSRSGRDKPMCPAVYPNFDISTTGAGWTTLHLIACLRLKTPVSRWVIRTKHWFEKVEGFEAVETEGAFAHHYRLWRPTGAPVEGPSEALLEQVASHHHLTLEAFESHLLIEWPKARPLGGHGDAGAFCDFCFALLSACPDVI